MINYIIFSFLFKGCRFYNAIYEFGNICVIQETSKTTAELIFIFITAVVGRMDLYGYSLSGRFRFTFYFGSVTTNI